MLTGDLVDASGENTGTCYDRDTDTWGSLSLCLEASVNTVLLYACFVETGVIYTVLVDARFDHIQDIDDDSRDRLLAHMGPARVAELQAAYDDPDRLKGAKEPEWDSSYTTEQLTYVARDWAYRYRPTVPRQSYWRPSTTEPMTTRSRSIGWCGAVGPVELVEPLQSYRSSSGATFCCPRPPTITTSLESICDRCRIVTRAEEPQSAP